jgi:hypothetical protein
MFLLILLAYQGIIASAPASFGEQSESIVQEQLLPGQEEHPQDLLKLAEEFRDMRGYTARRWQPSAETGVPDFAALVQKQKELLPLFRDRLDTLDPSNWSIHCQIDYLLLRAQMDKLEWELYVVRQTTRNPGFYVDQAIGNVARLLTGGRVMGEKPVLMPYTRDRAKAILKALDDTEKILEQARTNLTELVPELAEAALRFPGGAWPTSGWDDGQLKDIVQNYEKWAEMTAKHFPPEEARKLGPAAIQAAERLRDFGNWLEQNRSRMTGKYAIGKDILDWYIHHVFLMPYSTDELMLMAEMVRARAH